MWLSNYPSTTGWKRLSFLQNQLMRNIRVYYWILNPIPLIFLAILMLGQYCLLYSSFVVGFETMKSEPSNFVFLQKCFDYSRSLEFPSEF